MPARTKIDGSPPRSPPSQAARPCRTPAGGSIVDLKKLLAERFPPPAPSRPARLRTGLALLDQAIDGGLSQGAITEIISPHLSAGSASLIAALIQSAQNRDATAIPYPVALIDGRDSFDPSGLCRPDKSFLCHLLWLRCTRAVDAIKAADLLLRDGNFPLVILDLILNTAEELRKIPPTSWYRLQRLAEPISTALLVLSRQNMVASAQLKLVLHNAWKLCHLEADDAFHHLRLEVQRSHARSGATAGEAQAG